MKEPSFKNIREKDIEAYLVKQIKAKGGIAYKFVSPGHTGVPDRLVILPGGKVSFVELKAPGKVPTAQQHTVHREFAARGCVVWVLDSKEQVDAFIRSVVE